MRFKKNRFHVFGFFLLLVTIVFVPMRVHGEEGVIDRDDKYENFIDKYIHARLDRLSITPHWASDEELIRRMSLDLNGNIPDKADISGNKGKTAGEMVDYFMNKSLPLLNDPGSAYRMISQLIFSDYFLYSDQDAFSRAPQIASINALVGSLHDGAINYKQFAEKIIEEPAYLSRFVSPNDLNTITFLRFLGYEPVTLYDFQWANVFNGYQLDETTREATWLDSNCNKPDTSCVSNIWGITARTPAEAMAALVNQDAFAEQAVELMWHRYIGLEMSKLLPELSVALGHEFKNIGYDVRAMTKLILTSAAYKQSVTYRTD